ncbi:hypothetical protein ACQKDS_19755 [Serratia sp. NPDC078593]|uniref:hypothetical protein n=1 Tax=unclassified Serratia (in: enterobacteria) TaxID=2647522 RepID=UPI0037D8BCF4
MNKKGFNKCMLSNLKVIFIFFGSFFCGNSEASESWYVVDNYIGTIGKHPVHLSIQSYDFGGGVNIEGSYYYDRYNSPIVLFGKESVGNITLCEISSKKEFERYIVSGDKYDSTKCPFRIIKRNQILKGVWKNNNVKLDVVLSKVSSMNKSNVKSESGELDIPFWGDTEKHYFIGVYKQSGNKVIINKVKVINKNDGQVIQIINPQDEDCDFGFYMTPVYQNIERLSRSSILLNCYSKDSSISVEYEFKGYEYLKISE